ncbi:MAG: glycosyltransferase family 2 protein [Candidatus Cloacimonetes bacterium]|nr:glycosyltransferase family 2 protein [Candidatus Cloacimonadota bacterium]
MKNLSIVIPVFNDEKVLPDLYKRLKPVLFSLSLKYEIIFIDDGSSDNSYSILRGLQKQDANIKIIKLIRNFGQANAIAAGLEFVENDLIVVMDSDLQDRPEDIPKLISALEKDNVSMVIVNRIYRDEPFAKKLVSNSFFFFSNLLTNIKQPLNVRVFRIFKREALIKVRKFPDRSGTVLSRFYKAKIDYTTIALVREKSRRKSNYDLKKLLDLAFDRILPNLKIKVFRTKRSQKYIIEKFM